jgi:hypothetical protein
MADSCPASVVSCNHIDPPVTQFIADYPSGLPVKSSIHLAVLTAADGGIGLRDLPIAFTRKRRPALIKALEVGGTHIMLCRSPHLPFSDPRPTSSRQEC